MRWTLGFNKTSNAPGSENVRISVSLVSHNHLFILENVSDLKEQIISQLHESQSKYTFFLLAVAASCIALVVKQTTGVSLDWSHLPLGLAIFAWGLSFWSGCRNRAYFNSTLYANNSLLQLQEGSHPKQPRHPEAVREAVEGVRSAASDNSDLGNRWARHQFRFLIAGALIYLGWHIMTMASTPPQEPNTVDVAPPTHESNRAVDTKRRPAAEPKIQGDENVPTSLPQSPAIGAGSP
jgi:hypothetical protein